MICGEQFDSVEDAIKAVEELGWKWVCEKDYVTGGQNGIILVCEPCHESHPNISQNQSSVCDHRITPVKGQS